MNFSFLPEALQEFKAAAEYYAQCEAELDLRFIEHVDSAIANVISDPERWPFYRKDVRASVPLRCALPYNG